MNSDRHTPARSRALDGLRGVAVAVVLVFHVGRLKGGYIGVDVFFVLSGYLITSLLVGEWNRSGAIGLRSFWARRGRRLLPALILLLIGLLLVNGLVPKAFGVSDLRGDALSALTYTSNWRMVRSGTDYWAQFAAPSPLQHTWSLAIEAQFYLVWPIIVLLLLRLRNDTRLIAGAAVALAALSALRMAALADTANLTRAYFGTDSHAVPVLLGSALGAALTVDTSARRRVPRALLDAGAWIAALGIGFAMVVLDGQTPAAYRGRLFAVDCLCVAVVAACAQDEPGTLARLLSWRPLAALGAISYGVYLAHWPIDLCLTATRLRLHNELALDAVRFALTLAVAYVSYRLVEVPVRMRRGQFRSMRVLAPVAVALVVVLAVAFGANGPNSRFGTPAAAGSASDPSPPLAGHASGVRVMLFGDSVIGSLGKTFDLPGHRSPLTVWNRARLGCGLVRADSVPLPGIVTAEDLYCADYPNRWRDEAASFRPKVVVLLASAWDLFDRSVDGQLLKFGSRQWDERYARELQTGLDAITSLGAKALVLTLPYIDVHSPRLLPGYPAAFQDAHVKHLNDLVRRGVRARHDSARLIDLNRFVCPSGTYASSAHGAKDIRSDGVHFSESGRSLVIKWLTPQILDAA